MTADSSDSLQWRPAEYQTPAAHWSLARDPPPWNSWDGVRLGHGGLGIICMKGGRKEGEEGRRGGREGGTGGGKREREGRKEGGKR